VEDLLPRMVEQVRKEMLWYPHNGVDLKEFHLVPSMRKWRHARSGATPEEASRPEPSKARVEILSTAAATKGTATGRPGRKSIFTAEQLALARQMKTAGEKTERLRKSCTGQLQPMPNGGASRQP
jgi:hypothetical protein